MVFGSRALDRRLIGTHQPWTREQSGRVFNLIMKLLTGLPFKDTQCGFKAFCMLEYPIRWDDVEGSKVGAEVRPFAHASEPPSELIHNNFSTA